MAFGHDGERIALFHDELRGANRFTCHGSEGLIEVVLPKVYKEPGSPSIQVKDLTTGDLFFTDYRNLRCAE